LLRKQFELALSLELGSSSKNGDMGRWKRHHVP